MERPLWKRGSYWLVLVTIVLVVILTWYVAREVCEPAPISFECFEWTED